METLLMALSVAGAVLLWRELRMAREEVQVLSRSVGAARGEAERWRAEARELLDGLAVTMDRQFERWGLTTAEREVALLLLKGLSHREVAGVRDTSERTVREQAQAVYRKGGLAGRSELAAFFLEDLFLPVADRGES